MQRKLSEFRRGKTDVVGLILGAVIVAAVIFVWLYGKRSSQGGVAILNMEEVARQVGWDVESEKVFSREKAVAEADIARQRELLQADIDTKREEYGDSPTPGQQENLSAMEQQMQSQSRQLTRRAQESLQQVRGQQLKDFRSEVGPVIMKLASEKSFTVVLDPALSNVFFFDRSVDITDAVVDELKRQFRNTTLNDLGGTTPDTPLVAPGGNPVAP